MPACIVCRNFPMFYVVLHFVCKFEMLTFKADIQTQGHFTERLPLDWCHHISCPQDGDRQTLNAFSCFQVLVLFKRAQKRAQTVMSEMEGVIMPINIFIFNFFRNSPLPQRWCNGLTIASWSG